MVNDNMKNLIERIKSIMMDVLTDDTLIREQWDLPKGLQDSNPLSRVLNRLNGFTPNTPFQDKNDEYIALYQELEKEYKKRELKNPNTFSDLWEFHSYWSKELPTYEGRLNFVTELYKQNDNKTHIMDLWLILNKKITKLAKSRFESGHYADSVEASFKGINVRVKEMVKGKMTKELDGSALMHAAFSPENPKIELDNLESKSGQSVQQGYMELFSGSMIGIRNPQAHDNIIITKKKAIHFLFLASLLMDKLDEVK